MDMSSEASTAPSQALSATDKATGSCGSCRRRKLKCDRDNNGCSSCAKGQIPCIYPVASPSKGRKKRGPYRKDKSQREKELEHAIKNMETKYAEMESRIQRRESTQSTQIHVSQLDQQLDQGSCAGTNAPPSIASSNSRSYDSLQHSNPVSPSQSGDCGSLPNMEPSLVNMAPNAVAAPLSDRFWSPFSKDVSGFLSKSDGATLTSDQFMQVNQAVDESASAVQKASAVSLPASAASDQSNARQSVLLGCSLSTANLEELHPPQADMLNYWHIYTVRVEPMTRLLHPPSFSPKFLAASGNPGSVSRGMEALMFSIYFAAINSMGTADVQLRFASSKDDLLKKFETGVLHALAKADVMACQDLQTLQALVIYLVRFAC